MSVSRDEWARRWTASKRSSGTGSTYMRTIVAWFAFCDRAGVDVFDVEQHHVDQYRHTLDGLSPATVARHLATVSSYYRHVLRHGRPAPIDRNPVEYADRPKVDTVSRRDGLTKEEAIAVQAAAVERGPRAAALVQLLLGTALRVSEAVDADVAGLGWNDEGDRTLAVVRKGGRPDVVVIEPDDWRVIEHYLDTRGDVPGGYLFATTGGRRMSRQTAYREVRAVADGVVEDRKTIGPHSLRHTFATLALDEGLPIQEVQGALRHSSSATTQRYDRKLRDRGRGAARAVARARGQNSGEATA
jgi:integrase/recombinase XerD